MFSGGWETMHRQQMGQENHLDQLLSESSSLNYKNPKNSHISLGVWLAKNRNVITCSFERLHSLSLDHITFMNVSKQASKQASKQVSNIC